MEGREKQVQLADYLNSPRDVNVSDEGLIEDSLRSDTDAERDMETLSALGGHAGLGSGNFQIPQPVTAVFPLLEMIDSPFVGGKAEKNLESVIQALFVICEPRQAAKLLFKSRRLAKSLDGLEQTACSSPEIFYSLCKARSENAAAMSEFDSECLSFAEFLGVFDLDSAVTLLQDYLDACVGGLAMIPDKGESKKKAAPDSMRNGSRR